MKFTFLRRNVSIQLRDRYIPERIISSNIIINDSDSWCGVHNKCKNIIYLNQPGTYSVSRPRRWGKTRLLAELMNEFDNCAMLCYSNREEIRVRQEYNIKSPNCYNIYGNINSLVGVSYDWLLIDDLPEEKWTELVYYKGFGLTKYIRIGTHV